MDERVKRPYKIYKADDDAEYEKTFEIDLSEIRPTVAFPHLPENTKTIDEINEIKIDQVVIGSCTNGRLSDMKIAADILKGRQILLQETIMPIYILRYRLYRAMVVSR